MGQTKHRKGGPKVRKAAPQKRLNSTLDRFCQASNVLTSQRKFKEEQIITGVALGLQTPMSGEEFRIQTKKSQVAAPNFKRIARLLMPNASF